MEDDLAFHPQLTGVGTELWVPPAGADDVEAGTPAGRQIIEDVLDALVRDEAGKGDQPIRIPVRLRGQCGPTVMDDADVLLPYPQPHELSLGGFRYRHVRRAPVHARCHAGFQEPPEPAEQRARDRPLFPVTVVREEDRRARVRKTREERNAVLGVHHRIVVVRRRVEETRDVDRHLPAVTNVLHALFGGVGGHPLRASGEVRHRMPARGQVGADVLKVALGAATLGVVGIAPAQQEDLHALGFFCQMLSKQPS